MSIYREDFLRAQQDRLQGEIIIPRDAMGVRAAALIATSAAAIIVWASFAKVPRVEAAPGYLESATPVGRVTPPRSGRIASLYVHEGKHVSAGETLVSIDTEPAVQARLNATAALRRQITAVKTQLAILPLQTNPKLASKRADLAASQMLPKRISRQLDTQHRIIGSLQEILDRTQNLFDKGYSTRLELERRRQDLLKEQQQLTVTFSQRDTAISSMAKANADLRLVEAEAMRVEADLRQRLAALEEQIAENEGRYGYNIKSPVTGTVTAIQATVNKFVTPESPILNVVPDDRSVFAVIYIRSGAAGLVRAGSPVTLRYDALPYQRFGSFKATVTSVSSTTLKPTDTTGAAVSTSPAYRAVAKLDRQYVIEGDRRMRLTPGMELTASISLERRTLLDQITHMFAG